jgi:hypothetical protein
MVTKHHYKQYISERKNIKGNQEWTIQRKLQHCVHKTQEEEKQNKKHNTEQQQNVGHHSMQK